MFEDKALELEEKLARATGRLKRAVRESKVDKAAHTTQVRAAEWVVRGLWGWLGGWGGGWLAAAVLHAKRLDMYASACPLAACQVVAHVISSALHPALCHHTPSPGD